MIDDDFYPHRLQMRALGHLLDRAHKHPRDPLLEEGHLYDLVYMRKRSFRGDIDREEWLDELERVGLLAISNDRWEDDEAGQFPSIRYNDIGLTPAGAFYVISRSFMFAENARTPTDDFPDEIVDAPFILQSYYSPAESNFLPASDRVVSLDHNSRGYQEAIGSVGAVEKALLTNEFGAAHPEVRDAMLGELRQIRELLGASSVQESRLRLVAWGALGFLATEFAAEPIGYLAEHAWHAIMKLLGVG